MKRGLILFVALSFVVVSCGSGDDGDSGIASLSDGAEVTTTTAGDSNADSEQAMLDFAQCMRANGLPDFPDPVVGSDGSLSFGLRGQGAADAGIDPSSDTFQTAMQACGDTLQGAVLGADRGLFDPTELQDQLLQVAQCPRDKGFDVIDPQLDFSGIGPAGGERGPVGQSGTDESGLIARVLSIFGPNFDLTDPDNQAAVQDCADSLGLDTSGGFRVGGIPGGPPPESETTGTTSGG